MSVVVTMTFWTFSGAVTPVCGSVARTVSPALTVLIGLDEPSASRTIPPQASAAAARAAMAMAVQDGNCTPAEQILMGVGIIPASPS
ncbi:hypothetical protein OG894_12600 [Streptomyces sp. NBC_01724]|uniref:hypothetical protein n=1 Tax=unclassified Streptomyces TaxID=2593676 RepID=UPI002E31FAFE|nr:hypothetical protein [Streptomyces sp. NBC_01724]WTE54576.1 hypothetical protein OG987_29765 [Streptomyces sp. NBC_01620]